MRLTLDRPRRFSLRRTIYSHGWCSLQPFSVDKDRLRLHIVTRLSPGKVVRITVGESDAIDIGVESSGALTRAERREVVSIVRTCLRLDEDYSEFYAAARRTKAFAWVARSGSGRLLRAPTVFEDVVKMICTTNCSFALTRMMVKNLCECFGERMDREAPAFPDPRSIAGSTESFLRKEIRAGYRAPYLLELSRRVAEKDLNVEGWRSSSLPTTELFEEVRSIKGVGPYAAGNILKLLGRYDYLGIDSWCRKVFSRVHRNGRKVSDRTIEKMYEGFGKWRGLFFWMDMTRHWQTMDPPF